MDNFDPANPFGLGVPLPLLAVAGLVVVLIAWVALDRRKRSRIKPKAGAPLPDSPTQKMGKVFRYWSREDRKKVDVGPVSVPIGASIWFVSFGAFALALAAPSLSLYFTAAFLVGVFTQVGRASAYEKAQKALIGRLFDVCQANLSWPRSATPDVASQYITIDDWEGSIPTAVTIRIGAKDAAKKDNDKARFAAAFSSIAPGEKRWVFDWDTASMQAVGIAEEPLTPARQKQMNQIFTISKANLSWPADTTLECVDMYVDVQEWDDSDNPLDVVIKIDPKDAKKSKNDRARFAAAFSNSMSGGKKWVFDWDTVDLFTRGVATDPLSPERQAMVEKMFDICKANLSWDNDTTIECADAYIKVNKWAGSEPADFDITISARDAKKREEDRANFERIFSLAMSQDRRYVFEWFPNENRIHGIPTPPLPRMAPLPEIDERPWHEFPLGVGAGGKEIVWDCKPTPHALVVGKTGGGKSVIQRNILVHALSQPDEWQVALIDPKRVELGGYRPLSTRDGQGGVIEIALTLPEQVELLEKVEAEMMRRYDAMEAVGLNNAQNYIEPTTGRSPKAILLMVDEAFQLLAPEQGSSDQIKENNEYHGRAGVAMGSIARLGRAAKVHMVVATQRPDAKVLSGELKANLDCRIGCGTMDTMPSLMCFDDDSGTFITPVKGRAMIRQGGIPEEFQGYFFDADNKDVIAHIRKKMVIGGRDLSQVYPRLYDGEPGAPGFPIENRDAYYAEALEGLVDYASVESDVEVEEVEEVNPFEKPMGASVDFSRPQRNYKPSGSSGNGAGKSKRKPKGLLKKMYGDDFDG